jgi:peptide chain release factor subunit 1
MFTESDLRELLEFAAPDPVLSVYLNTEPSAGNADAYKLRLRNMLKDYKLPEDVEAIERYINQEFNWSGRSVAVFSCQPQGFFRAYPLAIPVANLIHISDRPSVKPLVNLMDSYGGYGVALVDQQGARLFHFHLGELTEQEGVLGEVVKRLKRGGSSSVHGRRGGLAGKSRSLENTVERNMKETADFAAHFFSEKRVRRVLICGTEDNIAMFRSELPKTWQSLVIGSFPMSMTASHNEVLQRTLQAGQEADAHRTEKLVADLLETASKGKQAVVGLEHTLTAINDSRVQTLVVVNGYRENGYHCPNCHALTINNGRCMNCNTQLESVPDVVETAIGTVLHCKGSVEVLQPGVSLSLSGNIAAMLRY